MPFLSYLWVGSRKTLEVDVKERVDYLVHKVLSAVESGRKDVGLIRACSIEMLPKEEQKKFKEALQNA